jgi:hypothetical protein
MAPHGGVTQGSTMASAVLRDRGFGQPMYPHGSSLFHGVPYGGWLPRPGDRQTARPSLPQQR